MPQALYIELAKSRLKLGGKNRALLRTIQNRRHRLVRDLERADTGPRTRVMLATQAIMRPIEAREASR